MNILTRGLGELTKLITRGFGREIDVAGSQRPRLAKRKKEYSIEIYAPVKKKNIIEINIYLPIQKNKNQSIKIFSNVHKTFNQEIDLVAKINYKKLFKILDAI